MTQFKVTNSDNSVSIRNTKTGSFISIQMVGPKFQSEQSTEKGDVNGLNSLKIAVKNLVSNRMNKKLSYSVRFSKVANILRAYNKATSFKVLANRLTSETI